MLSADIIVMGKTGSGKSTLINSVLNENVAPTGVGQAVTRENKTYSKSVLVPTDIETEGTYRRTKCNLKMYDTVGLEIDTKVTDNTLAEIKRHISDVKNSHNTEDVSLVWFCVSQNCSRFEKYEMDLIDKLSYDYEIPFVIVITQCISDEKTILEQHIKRELPNMITARVLAEEYELGNGITVPSYGVEDLLMRSINEYRAKKIKILERKSHDLTVKNEKHKEQRIAEIKKNSQECIAKSSSKAKKIAAFPAGCIPFVHGICISMVNELNKIAGISTGKDFATEIFSDVILGIVATPMMVVPLISIAAAEAYIEQVGEDYLKVLLNVVENTDDKELADNKLMERRIKEELQKLK